MRRFILLLGSLSCIWAADPSWVVEKGGVLLRDKAGNVTGVDLRSSWATDGDLAELAAMADLKQLDLSLSRVSDHGLRSLRGAPGIVDLNLYYAEQITDEGLSVVKGWKHLKRLNLRGTKITDNTLEIITTVPSLESLDIGFAEITDVGLDHLALLPNLRELTIGGNKLTDDGVLLLRQLPQLTYLDVSGSQRTDSGLWSVLLTDGGLESVATLTELKELRAGGTSVSARGLVKLKVLSKLERLDLQRCKRVGDDAVPVLSTFAKLRVLDIKDTAITEQGIAQLRKALPECQLFN
jgi:Leucine-rich repeat (LRR) protein